MTMGRIRKLVGALLGGVTGAGVAGLLALAGVEVEAPVATAIAVLLAAVGTWVAPANEPV